MVRGALMKPLASGVSVAGGLVYSPSMGLVPMVQRCKSSVMSLRVSPVSWDISGSSSDEISEDGVDGRALFCVGGVEESPHWSLGGGCLAIRCLFRLSFCA